MSRIGRAPVKVPSKVTVSVDKDIIVKGPKGELSMPVSNHVGIDINTSDNIITF